jgi:hypothetical protein
MVKLYKNGTKLFGTITRKGKPPLKSITYLGPVTRYDGHVIQRESGRYDVISSREITGRYRTDPVPVDKSEPEFEPEPSILARFVLSSGGTWDEWKKNTSRWDRCLCAWCIRPIIKWAPKWIYKHQLKWYHFHPHCRSAYFKNLENKLEPILS